VICVFSSGEPKFYVDAAVKLQSEYEGLPEDSKVAWLAEKKKQAKKIEMVSSNSSGVAYTRLTLTNVPACAGLRKVRQEAT